MGDKITCLFVKTLEANFYKKNSEYIILLSERSVY